MSHANVFVGPLLHCNRAGELEILENASVRVTEDGKIGQIEVLKGQSPERQSNGYKVTVLKPGQFLIPGFVDGHVHAVQFPNLGVGYDKPLLDWLETYTFPLEKQFADLDYARRVFDSVVQKTLRMGTTTACYYASMYNDTSLCLAEKVVEYGQRALIGKVNMNAPHKTGYTENSETSVQGTVQFINDIADLKSPLVRPIVTPRFALSCDMDLMRELAELATKENLHIQTHISENKSEVEAVQSVYSCHPTYASVYDDAGLLTNKTVLAHGIHLSDEELKIIKEKDSAIIHCPSSNTCLKSGLCDVRRLQAAGIKVGLGTDVSGGNFPSILDVMRCALEVSIHLSFMADSKAEYTPLNYKDVFQLATLGGAKALAMDDAIGNFEVGKQFDALVIDLDSKDSILDNFKDYSLEEKLQRLIYSGDDRNIVDVYVSGKSVMKRMS